MISKRLKITLFILMFLAFSLWLSSIVLAGDTRVGHFETIELSDGSDTTTVTAGSLSGDTTFKFPPTNGTSNYVLRVDGSGASTWVTGISTLSAADSVTNGYLTSTDWSTFNSKITNPMVAVGDTLYGGSAGAVTVLTGNITSTKKLLTQTGNGAASAAPGWNILVVGDIPSLPASQITSGTLAVAQGGTNLASGTSGGVLAYTASGVLASSAAGTASDWALSGGTGIPTFSSTTITGKFIDGSADQIQARIQAHSTQTSDILTVEKSDATLLFEVTNTAGTNIRGDTTGAVPATGFVGEILSDSNATQSCATTGNYRTTDEATVTPTPGTWDITGCSKFIPGATTTYTRLDIGYSTTPGNSFPDAVALQNVIIRFSATSIPVDELSWCGPTYRVTVASNTPYYLKSLITFGVSTCSDTQFIRATRIK